MSDPVTNAEIEDVLSSIRRLVSEDSRDLRKPQRPLVEPAPIEHGRLVLTPALRVADPVEKAETASEPEPAPESPSAAAAEPVEAPWADPDATLFLAAGRGIAEPAGEKRTGDEVEAEVAETTAPTGAGRPDDAAPVGHDMAAESAALDELGGGDPDFATIEVERDDPFRDMPDTAEAPQWDADDSGDDRAERTGSDQTPDADRAAETAFFEAAGVQDGEAVFPTDTTDGPGPVANDEPIDGSPGDVPLGPTVAALAAAIGETADQWEPDGAGGDEYAGTPVETLQWEDHTQIAETPRDRAPDPTAFDPAPDMAAGFAATDGDAGDRPNLMAEETILDEESLRELVTDIVREELQGALGERITRNVRKLVRREIHRALTAQELE